MRNKYVQRILDMPPEKRRHVRVGRKRKHFKRTDKIFSRNELISWVKERNIKSRRGFFKNKEEDGPSFFAYIKEFGTWGKFKNIVWKEDIIAKTMGKAPNDPGYIIDSIIQYDLWIARDYELACKNNPEIIPSMYWIKYHFGRWSQVTRLAKLECVEFLVKKYMELKKKYNRWPTYTECKSNQLDLELLYDIHGGKKQLDSFLQKTMEINDAE